MTSATIGILHPGAMGAAVGAALVAGGHVVLWLPDGRSPATRTRAERAGLTASATLAELTARSDVILSICPPEAALDVARAVAPHPRPGVFVDANAVSPATAREIAAAAGGRHVDGSIIGPPPAGAGGATRLYLSGPGAGELAPTLTAGALEARALDNPEPFAASALKMAYAGWTKGSAALLLATAQAARRLGVETELHAEWAGSQPQLADRLVRAEASRTEKGWRWAGEMREIAATLRAEGLPDGFHEAAAEIYASAPRPAPDPGAAA